MSGAREHEKLKEELEEKIIELGTQAEHADGEHCECNELATEASYLMAQAEVTKAKTMSWFLKFIAFALTFILLGFTSIIAYPMVFGEDIPGIENSIEILNVFKEAIVSLVELI